MNKFRSLLGRISAETTGVAKNFDWGGPKTEKFCDVILVT